MVRKIILISLFLTLNLVWGQNSNEVIKKLQEKFKSIENLRADFNQSSVRDKNSDPFVMKGKFIYAKENNFVINFSFQKIVTNGETLWNYNKKMNRVVISSYADEPSAFSINAFVMDYPSKCKILEVDKNTIKMIPETDEIQFNSVKIMYDNNFMVKQIEVEDFSETKYRVDLFNVSINKETNFEIFKLIPPEGAQIVDLR